MSGDEDRRNEYVDLDALLSAERDGALDAEERARLEALRAAQPASEARRAAFASVDAALRDLADAPLDARAIEAGLAGLAARTVARGMNPLPATPSERGASRAVWRRPFVPVVLAAAAAFFLYLALGTPAFEASRGDGSPGVLAVDQGDQREESNLVPGVDDEDLAVIEALDVLDFMAEREQEGRG